ncbi:unnamed protein product [Effrenium voratum]|nr:unnamed protein product [Effrenium voratum]
MFMPDSNFCRQCGAPRKGTAAMAFASAPVASPPTLAPGSSFAEATAEQASPNSSVHLQVLVLLGEKWLWAHGAAELVLLLAKNLKFDYPPGWALAELAMIAVYLLVQILHRSSGSFANRAKSTSSMAFFLGLCGMLVLLAGYLTALQVYVMQVEFAMGLVSMSLLGCQLVLGTFAGQRHAARTRDLVFLYLAAAVAVAASITALVLDTTAHAFSAEQMHAALIAGLSIFLANSFCTMVFWGIHLSEY